MMSHLRVVHLPKHANFQSIILTEGLKDPGTAVVDKLQHLQERHLKIKEYFFLVPSKYKVSPCAFKLQNLMLNCPPLPEGSQQLHCSFHHALDQG